MLKYPALVFCTFVVMVGAACNMPRLLLASPPAVAQGDPPVATTQPREIPTPTYTFSPSPTSTPTATPIPTVAPYGCLRPPDDYTRVNVREHVLSQRALSMLEHAQALYGGTHDFFAAITQGSYTSVESASFGTHDRGGAVDLSVRDLYNWNSVLYGEFDIIILALRQAGFAAWVRDVGALYPGSPIHIHAIAIGDAELSEAAQRQLTGPEGYFRGFNGLPVDPPLPDDHGGPYICPWMLEMGYADLRGTP